MRRVVVAGMIGNGFEWYDFALYGYFAPVIGKLFFPGSDAYVHMIAAYGIFAAGFFMRPVGAIFFGYLGDVFGRRLSLTLAILLMAFPTAFIGIMPTYHSIGVIAPVLLTIIRLLQGMALAGQFSGSMAFVVEHSPIKKRGLVGSSTIVSLCAGMLLGSLTATTCTTMLNPSEFESWGWRIPFLFGLMIAFAGFYIRRNTDESPHYEKAKKEGRISSTPVRTAIREHWPQLLRGIGMYMAVTVPFYTLTVFLNSFLPTRVGITAEGTYFINTVSMFVMMLFLPFTAHLTDVLGRKRVLQAVTVVYMLTTYPIFVLMTHGGFTSALIAELLFTIVVTFYISSIPALLVELFPTSVRYTGMSISYNIAAVIGGMTPMLETWLIQHTQSSAVIAVCVIVAAAISYLSFIGYHDAYKEELA